jgi:hypothetical protein
VRVVCDGGASGRQQTNLTDADSARSPMGRGRPPSRRPARPLADRQINTTTTASEEGCTGLARTRSQRLLVFAQGGALLKRSCVEKEDSAASGPSG